MLDEAKNRAAGNQEAKEGGFISKAAPLGEDFVLKLYKEQETKEKMAKKGIKNLETILKTNEERSVM
jgi:hypothetical protein